MAVTIIGEVSTLAFVPILGTTIGFLESAVNVNLPVLNAELDAVLNANIEIDLPQVEADAIVAAAVEAAAELIVQPPEIIATVQAGIEIQAEITPLEAVFDFAAGLSLSAVGITESVFEGTPAEWVAQAIQCLPVGAQPNSRIKGIIGMVDTGTKPIVAGQLNFAFSI